MVLSHLRLEPAKNPLKVETMEIKDIHVVETFKEGKSVYKR